MKHASRLVLAVLALLLVCALPEAYAFFEEYTVEATFGQSVTAPVADWGDAYFSFTPAEDGLYMLSLTKGAQGATYNLNCIDQNGDSINGCFSSLRASDTAFRWILTGEAGTVYYFRASCYQENVEAFELTVSEPPSDAFFVKAKQETIYTDLGQPGTLKALVSAPAGTEVTYQWRRQENDTLVLLADATGNTYTIPSVQQNEEYECTVTCSDGNTAFVYFYSKIDTHFSMAAVGATYVTAGPGEAVTLRVNAGVVYGGLTYEWYEDGILIPDQTADSITITPQDNYSEFRCTATDASATSKSVRFYIDVDNQLFARAAQEVETFWILPGETATLRVIAGCRVGDVHYQWATAQRTYNGDWYYDNDGENIDGATTDTLAVTEPGHYKCTVTDDYGSQRYLSFEVGINNGFVTWVENERDDNNSIPVEYDGSLTMKIGAVCNSGPITYRWYHRQLNEQWYSYSYSLIEGAETSSYHVDHVTQDEYYTCWAFDQYGNASQEYFILDVGLEGTLVVQYASNSHFTMGPNDTYTMAVRAYSLAENATISYQWYYQDREYELHPVENDGNGPTCTIDVNSVGYEFYCEVSDSNGNKTAKWFYPALDTPLTASQNCYEARVLYGESAEFSVEAETDYGPLTYQWYVESADTQWERVPIEGATAASYTVTPVEMSTYYYSCEIRDRYRKITKLFSAALDFPKLSAKGDQFVSFQEGDEVTLQVQVAGAKGHLSYEWRNMDAGLLLEGETSDTLVVTPPAGVTNYRCILYDDGFDEEWNSFFDFFCTSVAWPELPLGETLAVQNSNDVLRYSFTPAVGGMYHVNIGGTVAYTIAQKGQAQYPIDAEWIDEENKCFRLDAGVQYCFMIHNKGTFRMTKIADSETLPGVLRTGQKVIIPFINRNSFTVPVSGTVEIKTATSDQPSVIRVSNGEGNGSRTITALSAGSATITVEFENGFVRYYQITVYSDAGVVKTPPEVRIISDETFAGDTSVQFADLSRVKYIGNGAFSGSGIKQVVLEDAQIAPDAFAGANPVFVSTSGSVEAFAYRNGFTVFWLPN